ncbi:hypothetical protein [Bacillus piscicola]|uniref:hypothetical protein n=1 Tax=Bacillus piscicola TaxID=1632684 RepID=UPI001F0975C7|nr:hypothetical protein [Bacillus piscicola]
MKRTEWIMASIFIMLGLHCLVTACTLLPGAAGGSGYFSFLLQICFWTGIPLLGGFVIYMTISIINKQKGKAR